MDRVKQAQESDEKKLGGSVQIHPDTNDPLTPAFGMNDQRESDNSDTEHAPSSSASYSYTQRAQSDSVGDGTSQAEIAHELLEL